MGLTRSLDQGESPALQRTCTVVAGADGHVRCEQRAVPIESPLAIQVNDVVVAHLMRLPGHDAELALGFCYTEGLISGLSDVRTLQVCDDDSGRVELRVSGDVRVNAPLVLTSACVGPRAHAEDDLPPPLPGHEPRVAVEMLLTIPEKMRTAQETHRTAGAVHATALFAADGQLLVAREDVGRHNAIDKAIGYCLYRGHPLEACLLVSTGRASSEMILKAAAARVPIAVSRSGPTSLGVELACKLGVTLVCYLRPSRMTIYAHPERIIGQGQQ